jgi:hypothetical protein
MDSQISDGCGILVPVTGTWQEEKEHFYNFIEVEKVENAHQKKRKGSEKEEAHTECMVQKSRGHKGRL